MSTDNARRLAQRARFGRQPEDRSAKTQADQERDALATIDRGVEQVGTYVGSLADEALKMFASVVDRPISRDRDNVYQRCRACRAEIVVVINYAMIESANTGEWIGVLGHAVRVAYDQHQCAPVAAQLHGFSASELDVLLETTEQEALRCMARTDEIRSELRRRSPSEAACPPR